MNLLTSVRAANEPQAARTSKLQTSIVKIMDGALKAIAAKGIRRLSMSDISDASGISRGTLYRYFSTKEDVLAAIGEFVSSNFEAGIVEAAQVSDDPMERFRAVMRFFAQYTNEHTPERLFEVEPSFYLTFFRSHFNRHTTAVKEALNLTFNYLDTVANAPIDRDGLSEALVRMQLSTLIIPAETSWTLVWERVPEKLEEMVIKFAGRQRATKEH
jgi:AcrR family transcriptional regulator